MRKSAKKEDRGQPWNEGWAKYIVNLNGVKLERAVAADDVEGWADCYRDPIKVSFERTPAGGLRRVIEIRRYYGKIELIRK